MKYKTKLFSIMLAGTVLTAISFLCSMKSREEIQTVVRPGSGEGSREEILLVELEDGRYPFHLTLSERPYGKEEIEKELQRASAGLEKIFLKENTDVYHVVSNVFMPSSYPGTKVAVQWNMESWKYIEPDGTVKNEGLSEPVSLKVQAVLALEDQSFVWKRDLKICPPSEPDTDQKLRMLEYQIQELQEEDADELLLPQKLGKDRLVWYQRPDDRWVWIAGLTIAALSTVWAGQRQEEERMRKQKERSMALDYPGIVSRLSLYMGAGISTRKAWERIAEDYEKKNREQKKSRAAYEEMCTTLHEMQSGIPEALAYERFGTRCHMPSYLKLGTLLSQNLRKGTRNLSELLKEEAEEAFKNRKALARQMGEECESKLLLPMILMLLTILIMIMYPAVASFQV